MISRPENGRPVNFDDVFVSAKAYRFSKKTEEIARWIFANPNQTLEVDCKTDADATKLFWDLKLLYGLDLKNLKFAPKEKVDGV